VPTISRRLKIRGLFCKRALQKRRYSAKETCKHSHPIPCRIYIRVELICVTIESCHVWNGHAVDTEYFTNTNQLYHWRYFAFSFCMYTDVMYFSIEPVGDIFAYFCIFLHIYIHILHMKGGISHIWGISHINIWQFPYARIDIFAHLHTHPPYERRVFAYMKHFAY